MPHILRRAVVVLAVAALITGLETASAWADLRTESEITYVADVEDGVLAVESRLMLTNLTPNVREGDTITRFFYEEIGITVPETARNFRTTSGGQQLFHTLSPVGGGEGPGYLLATIDLGRQLQFEETMEVVVQYEIPGDPARSATTFRINPAYINFAVFGWGDPGRVAVNVVTPTGFELEFVGSEWDETRTVGGTIIHSVSGIDQIEDFVIHVKGYDDSALVATPVAVDDAEIVVRSWPDDEEWSDLVSATVATGLPVLMGLTGLPWVVEDPLPVNESAEVSLAGYGGWYLRDEQLIELSEWAEPHVVLHELSHVWFNHELFVGRWINEGLAEVFSRRAAVDAGLADESQLRLVEPPPDTAGVGPLNEWVVPDAENTPDPGQIRAEEEYGYATSQWVIQEVTDEIGFDAMAEVLSAAASDLIAYRGAAAPEQVGPSDDWRRLLDLLEDWGGSTTAGELFRVFVTDEDLSARESARAMYRELVDLGQGWLPPFYVREPMSSWEFGDATTRMVEAETVLDARFQAEANLALLGLKPTSTLEDAYESATETIGEAVVLANSMVEATDTVVEARQALDADRNPIMQVGLLGSTPEAEYREAEEALEDEDLEGAIAKANELVTLLEESERTGQLRIGVATGVVVLVISGTVLILVRRRRGVR